MAEDLGHTFLAYLNDDDNRLSGYFDVVEITLSYVKFRTDDKVTIIPMHRILKIKVKEDKP